MTITEFPITTRAATATGNELMTAETPAAARAAAELGTAATVNTGATGAELMVAATPSAAHTTLQLANSATTLSHGEGAPNNANGANGDIYIDSTNGLVYKKTAGVWNTLPGGTPQSLLYFLTELPVDAFGNNGDQAILHEVDGAINGLAEKSAGTWVQIASANPLPPDPELVLNLVDDFIGGFPPSAGTILAVGRLGWYFVQTVGVNNVVTPWGGTDGGIGRIGQARLSAYNVAGQCCCLTLSSGTSASAFKIDNARAMEGFFMEARFRLEHAGQSFHFGFSSQPAATLLVPTRFTGIKALAGETNFQYESKDGASITTVDSGIPRDTLWHRFRLTWNGTAWLMSIDGGTPVVVTNRIGDASTVTITYWNHSTDAVWSHLYLSRFQLYGLMQ